ncbi:unnamed protein product [Rotaria sordida]|uniref:Uncharacterized protein n=1 Tax=Rotaria sordida TaxID=392033 RepID=A0A815U1K5_9BILA|nr:unnamed protein product [Rotaria sordida]
MQTFDDITFNGNLYTARSSLALLLYEQNGVAMAIPLANANLMSFIRVFGNARHCRDHMETNQNRRKMITLFAYDENMHKWLTDNATDIPPNLQEIKIFCKADDRAFVAIWARRHIRRFKNATFEIISCDRLNYEFGVDFLEKLHSDFRPRSRLQRRSYRNYKRICHALANYFWHEANRENV